MEFTALDIYSELAEFPPAFYAGFQPDAQHWQVLAEDIRALMFLLSVTPTELQKKQSALPVPDRYDPGKGWSPRKVSAGTLSMWLTGQERWPSYRLAATVAILELRGLQMAVRLAATPKPDILLARRIKLAETHYKRLGADPALSKWLVIHRAAIHEELKRNRKKSDAHGELFALYHDLMPREALRELEKGGKPERKNRRESA